MLAQFARLCKLLPAVTDQNSTLESLSALFVVVCEKKGVYAMAEQPISLLPLYQGWDTYQALLIKAIEPLSVEQLSLRAAPQLRSIGELASHIIGVRAGWLYYNLGKGDESMTSLASQPARSAAELVHG